MEFMIVASEDVVDTPIPMTDLTSVSLEHDDGVDEELEALLESDREELEALGGQTELALDGSNEFSFDDVLENYLFEVGEEDVDQSLMPTQLNEISATQFDGNGCRFS